MILKLKHNLLAEKSQVTGNKIMSRDTCVVIFKFFDGWNIE
ncbi:hypothetical protein SAMN04488519_103320 [Algoriphagus ornithinivorans]|uniref:Uncharacterized protein n=1 Tax=Algoriphagus ornithinivorans TaxID=226506 RepID=A0A1I5E6Y7_9BACT|nr:hypothetical protein SAMN04488519_103320 [Algoriphagus ornithinivorans]